MQRLHEPKPAPADDESFVVVRTPAKKDGQNDGLRHLVFASPRRLPTGAVQRAIALVGNPPATSPSEIDTEESHSVAIEALSDRSTPEFELGPTGDQSVTRLLKEVLLASCERSKAVRDAAPKQRAIKQTIAKQCLSELRRVNRASLVEEAARTAAAGPVPEKMAHAFAVAEHRLSQMLEAEATAGFAEACLDRGIARAKLLMKRVDIERTAEMIVFVGVLCALYFSRGKPSRVTSQFELGAMPLAQELTFG